MNSEDLKIVKEIKKGNLKTFEMLFKKLYTRLCNYANKYVHNIDVAEEIVQELFYKLWAKREKLEINISLKSYLYRAVYNGSLQYLNHRNIELRYEDYRKREHKVNNTDASEEVRTQELYEIINKTLNSLPERCRKIFHLNRYEGLKYWEIAEKLSLSVKTIEANISRALKLLRKNLKEYNEV